MNTWRLYWCLYFTIGWTLYEEEIIYHSGLGHRLIRQNYLAANWIRKSKEYTPIDAFSFHQVWVSRDISYHTDGLVQERCNSSALVCLGFFSLHLNNISKYILKKVCLVNNPHHGRQEQRKRIKKINSVGSKYLSTIRPISIIIDCRNIILSSHQQPLPVTCYIACDPCCMVRQ